ncbi:Arabinogalactan endo-beta-1,4-galactanase [Sphingomonas sp. EC-HK361]|uniref:glycoside hydrolase family 53 protein n=1 Tax=Sphingomonas sp. EC-HK361 TaxID=2038397 RepID=UPI00125897A4|nr:arabinogalactan endo-1,4-beta-galactosidase [Sphingomonas sp. EC-HK361]VVT19180.1 Arabinogalactan endo-beta-1,4-galactanase [Sphingomonas sp. EC-HK361]
MRHVFLMLALAAALTGPAIGQSSKPRALPAPPKGGLYLGGDLSYVNEMEDCGAIYRDRGKRVDPFRLLARKGGNLVRVRLWNDATWTRYSNYADVLKTIRRAKAAGMQVLLDFHYSDDWADGDKQLTPKAWEKLGTEAQAKALHDYTVDILTRLNRDGAMPEMVQVGNETNQELLGGRKGVAIDWTRNATLFNAGIAAVRAVGRTASINPRVMLHIAQPENVLPWFDAAKAAGVADYDVIGISYYRKWSKFTPDQLKTTVAAAKARFGADVIVVETGYPFTLAGKDSATNLLGADALVPGFPASPRGQRDFMVAITQDVIDAGGIGVVYWEPNWVSTKCGTRWGNGSDWENAAWFDYERTDALPVFDFLAHRYRRVK